MKKAAYVTLLTRSSYLAGTLVLQHTLNEVGSKYPLVVMVTLSVPHRTKDVLRGRGLIVTEINYLQPSPGVHKVSENDTRFADTWTKLSAFSLDEYERVVLLDSDMIVMRNMDELFDLELPKDGIAAAHVCACNPRKFAHYPADWIPANCAYTAVTSPLSPPPAITEDSPRPYEQLNSGLVVLDPSIELSTAIVHYLSTSPLVPSFAFPDQDLLAAFFRGKWLPLPWYYNALKPLRLIHKPLWDDNEIRCLHYILPDKPWQNREGGAEFKELHQWWWNKFDAVAEGMKDKDQDDWEYILANTDK